MSAFFTYIIAFIITFPIPMTIAFYILMRKLTRNKRKTLHLTVNCMTLIYIFSVNATLAAIFEKTFIWYIFILLILLLGLFVFLHWKYKEEVHFTKAWKGFWRLSFLLFVFSHIGLTLYGLTDRLLAL